MAYCCEKCFYNKYIQNYIQDNGSIGACDYCGASDVSVVEVSELGKYFRECFDKAYETLDAGTGAYYDGEEKEYCGPTGTSATRYSVIEILEGEFAFPDETNHQLVEDIIKYSGPSDREIQQGDFDLYGDIYDECFVLRNDLYGVYGMDMYYNWESFKFLIKHYNRFFDVDGFFANIDIRKELLESIKIAVMEYEQVIPVSTLFYRARRTTINDLHKLDFDSIVIDKELSPPSPKFARTNRMSPAGISYLYVSSNSHTATKECRYMNEEVIIAEFSNKKELQIIDFSQKKYVSNMSIFSDDYDHNMSWINNFLSLFAEEISKPVDENIDRAYEYVATQFIAEYIRCLGYDGIGYKSSVDQGISYCFFCGPDLKYCKSDYGILDDMESYFKTLPSFNEIFNINSISLYNVSEEQELRFLNKTRNL